MGRQGGLPIHRRNGLAKLLLCFFGPESLGVGVDATGFFKSRDAPTHVGRASEELVVRRSHRPVQGVLEWDKSVDSADGLVLEECLGDFRNSIRSRVRMPVSLAIGAAGTVHRAVESLATEGRSPRRR